MLKRSGSHLDWIRTLPCCVPGCRSTSPVQAHHVRSAATSGTALKPSDLAAIPCCADHHREGHDTGWRTFEAKYGIDLAAEAVFYATASRTEMP